MSVFNKFTAASTLMLLLGGQAYAQNFLGSGGITNIPTVSGYQTDCCGTATGQLTGIPSVYVPGYTSVASTSGASTANATYNMGATNMYNATQAYGYGAYNNANAYYGGYSSGGTYSAIGSVYTGMIENMNVIGGANGAASGSQSGMQKIETKTVSEIVPIRAICMDDLGAPHPASRVDGNDQVEAGGQGEVYRCMAGTAMEVTIGRMVDNKAVFDGGTAMSCAKGQALGYVAGNLTCVAQAPAVNCNERSLLRRFGPGIKYVALTRTITTSTKTAQASAQTTSFRSSMFVDGGVGQSVY
jgi:hypothetical protein